MILPASIDVHPIMGPHSKASDFASISMHRDHLSQLNIKTDDQILSYQDQVRVKHEAKWLLGGYLERRALYQSDLFVGSPGDTRDIHLGLDIWGEIGTPVYAPIDAIIHSFAYNDHELDYGYTLILEHDVSGQHFHTLYGHLSNKYFDQWSIGANISAGDVIADLGSKKENGGWLPHLHFQIMLDMEEMSGDYPGVCSQKRLPHYQANCPDPSILIKKSA